ncbi:hypothetical protein CsSME_00033175 [Camellia sinensis var. sinensis]
MDSKLCGVPLSATQATPSAAELYPKPKLSLSTSSPGSSFSSLPIRAPPTVDSDFEFSLSTNRQENYSSSYESDSAFESDGFVSGEDGFDTASEKLFVTDPDDETLGESRVVEDCVVSRPFVTDPDEETLEISMEEEEEEEEEYVDEPLRKQGVPIAMLSRDSDDDSVGSEEEEDDGVLGSVRVPGIRILEKTEVEGGEDESQFEPVMGSSEGCIALKDSANDYVSVEMIEDRGFDDVEGATVESFVVNEDDFPQENPHLVGENQGLENLMQRESESNERSIGVLNGVGLGDHADAKTLMGVVIECAGDEKVLESSEIDKTGPLTDEKGTILMEFEANADGDLGGEKGFTVEGVEVLEGEGTFELGSDLTNCASDETIESKLFEADGLHSESNPLSIDSIYDPEVTIEMEDKTALDPGNSEDGSLSEDDSKGLDFGVLDTTKLIMDDLEQSSTPSSLGESSEIPVIGDSDEEVEADGDGEGKELFDSSVLAALLKAATNAGSGGANFTVASANGSRAFSLEHPAHSSTLVNSLSPALQPNGPSLFTGSELTARTRARVESEEIVSEEEKKKLEKLQMIRVKFFRLLQRVGLSPEDSMASQVLYRLVLAAGRPSSQSLNLESAKRTALQLEEEGKNDLDFSLNILVLGKTGVGKSATVNSIFGEKKAIIDAFEPATTAVKDIVGMIDGIKVRIFDTPGLRSSVMEQAFNRKILLSVKKLTKKCPPDIVLYVDRLDTQTRDLNDLPLLRSITSLLGSSIWHNAIVTLTHAASSPPDGPSGSPLSYDLFVAQRSRVVLQLICQAVGDLRMMNPSQMSPVSLVENHPLCQKRADGQVVLPSGECWRPRLLLLCYSMKILSEANSAVKTQDLFDHRKLFGFRARTPPLHYLLSSLLQSNAHPKLSSEQGGDNIDSDTELGDMSDSDQEDENEYEQLPPFKPLKRSQIVKLSKEQSKAYFEEYDYRVRLLQKKQWRDEVKRSREMKKRGKDGPEKYGYVEEDGDDGNGSPAAVSVPLPDMALPPSFDGDNPAHRYRFLEPMSQLLTRPVLDVQGWDHDCGYNGVSLESSLAIAGCFPAVIAVQITKDKKDFNIHLDSSVAAKQGENRSTMAGLDIQAVGKQLAYILKGETKIRNFKTNKTTAGVSITFLGENVATGLKIEDQIAIGKRLVLVGSTGAMRSQSDTAYGANFEVRVREKDFPVGQDQTTLGLSLMWWRGDLVCSGNLQSQFSVGRSSKMVVRAGLNSKLSGQISIRTSSSEQLQIAVLGILPIAKAIFRYISSAQ